jgi:hypothetical protein
VKKLPPTTTVKVEQRCTEQVNWARDQVDDKLSICEFVTMMVDWACTPEGYKTLRAYRVDQILNRS